MRDVFLYFAIVGVFIYTTQSFVTSFSVSSQSADGAVAMVNLHVDEPVLAKTTPSPTTRSPAANRK